ncbi:caspase domain-containing protein (plasmid) [Ensifer adhaerens]|uniref:caspase family protein n=1 Tax=Ensifer adhaerens TaxID=106592 RepID=UPI0023A9FB4D|nr:caspase domain-containing protein [Ensifer adhaerens]WDZ81816.1 caspase domain-containing protein [Ensifer adhaerens]
MRYLRAVVLLSFFFLSSYAWADKRVALVIGNSAYQHAPPLANPQNDASDMTSKLTGLGFVVVTGRDLDLTGMRRSIREFVGKVEGADVALFFYAGHGLQVNGGNYMIPVDAQLRSNNDLDFEALPIELVLSAMERNARVSLVFLDACRDNPLAATLARSMGTRSMAVGRGLAKLDTGVGSLIAFATQPGNVALDGAGRNSPFTTALLNHLGTPGQSITDDLIAVRRTVLQATDGKQVPWDSSSLTGPVVLNPSPVAATATSPVATTDTDRTVELTYWNSIKDLTASSFFEAYLQEYPNGAFATLAKLKIAAIAEREKERQATEQEKTDSKRAVDPKDNASQTNVAALEQTTPEAQASGSSAGHMAAGDLALATQSQLARIGCLSQIDGKWGESSQKALKEYAVRRGLKLASLSPTEELLNGLMAIGNRVCPLVCGNGTVARDNRCVEPGLSAYDGAWYLTRHAKTDCGDWRELSTLLFVRNGVVSSSSSFSGKISSNGSVNIASTFVHKGRKGGNTVTGMIKGGKGTGRFKGTGAGSGCSGVITMTKM